LKKRTKKLLQLQAEPLRKGRSQLSKSFLLLFFKKAGLPAAGLTCGRLPGQLQKKNQKTFECLDPTVATARLQNSHKSFGSFLQRRTLP
jgi:hypothetical protein